MWHDKDGVTYLLVRQDLFHRAVDANGKEKVLKKGFVHF